MKANELNYEERELAKYIYEHYISTRNYGRVVELNIDEDTFAELKDYYDSGLKKWTYNKIIRLFNNTLSNEHFRYYENDIELDDTRVMWDINTDIDEETYWFYADCFLRDFDTNFGVETLFAGRGYRHIVIKDNIDNFINYNKLRNEYIKVRNNFIEFINSNEWKEETA